MRFFSQPVITMSAWLLPPFIADVLPSEARRIEDVRRELLDTARSYGYELVMPPMLEHLESLVGDDRQALDLKTFKLVDQLSGRMLGVRSDTTPQVARIDAHLLNRESVTRLCYCGPVLHTVPSDIYRSREALQFGAELYGYAGPQADLEVQVLVLSALSRIGVRNLVLDLADVRIVRSLLGGVLADAATIRRIYDALTNKDAAELNTLTRTFSPESRHALQALLHLYGEVSVLDEAARILPKRTPITQALSDLRWLGEQVANACATRVSFDLADLRGYGYYTGSRFTVYAQGSNVALARGGRYDEIGAIYGRNRPAVGFSLDVRLLAPLTRDPGLKPAVLAPWSQDGSLLRAIVQLRQAGEVVVCRLPGQVQQTDEFACDRELVFRDGVWVVVPYLSSSEKRLDKI